MAKSSTQTLGDVRAFLNDRTAPYRYDDADLLQYLEEGIAVMYRLRPDFHVVATQPTGLSLSTTLPAFIERDGYYPALCDYVVSRAEMRDDQYVDEGLAMLLMQKFQSALLAAGV